MWSAPANLRAGAALTAVLAAFALAGCGGGERRDADSTDATYTVDIVRAQFPARQHLAEKPTFEIAVRNTGEETIPSLAVTLHGFSARSGDAAQADARTNVWVVDEPPAGTVTAVEDTWSTGALAAGRQVSLRWRVTPVSAGTHKLDYSVSAGLAGSSRIRLADGDRPRGSITVNVDAKPSFARVDPRTGRVVRE
ncbi:MAG TPA: hypothetical protein VMY78_04815 [Solirubrobacteraceae bacterium]|nr:hypothetical protein [Solirubrobacteraceae bacterium]